MKTWDRKGKYREITVLVNSERSRDIFVLWCNKDQPNHINLDSSVKYFLSIEKREHLILTINSNFPLGLPGGYVK